MHFPHPFPQAQGSAARVMARRFGSLLYLLLLPICLSLQAVEKPQISASVDPIEIRPGAMAEYSITFEHGIPDELLPLQLPAGIDAVTTGPQRQIIPKTKRMPGGSVLSWQISATEPGQYEIPPQEYHIGGVPYMTNATKLVVTTNPAYPVTPFDPLMTMRVEKRELYVGEVMPITVSLYIHRRATVHRYGLVELPKDSFAVQRFPLLPEDNIVPMGGQEYHEAAFHSTMSALKPGKMKLGPPTMEVQIEVPLAGNGNYNPLLGSMTDIRRYKPEGNEIELLVKPVPEQGKPKSFSGAVGQFDFSITAEPKQMVLGDPIAIEMVITGTGNFDAIVAPPMTNAENWKIYPARRFSPDGVMSANVPVLDGEKLAVQRLGFTQVIMPKKVVDFIPSFEFSYFDPQEKKYVTRVTEPIPIQVTAAEHPAEAAPLETRVAVPATQEEPEKVPPPKANITDIITFSPRQATWIAASHGLWSDPKFRTANLAICGLLLLLVSVKMTANAISSYRVQARTPQRVLLHELCDRHLSRGRFYQLASTYIQSFATVEAAATPTAQAIVDRHLSLNFAQQQDDANGALNAQERAQVIKALRSLA